MSFFVKPKESITCDKVHGQPGSSLGLSMNEMRENNEMTDVTFVVGSEQRVKLNAHKLILVGRSPVFRAMFTGNLAEKGEVSIPDIEPDVFEVMLRYIYEDKVQLSYKFIDQYLYACDKYDLKFMKQECVDLLLMKLSAYGEGLLYIFQLALKYNLGAVVEECAKIIASLPEKYIKTDNVFYFNQETLKILFSRDDLALDELSVFQSAMHWAKRVCSLKNLCICGTHIRECLGPVLYEIRFPLIDGEVFVSKIIPENILSVEETCDIFKNIFVKTNGIFKSVKRKEKQVIRYGSELFPFR